MQTATNSSGIRVIVFREDETWVAQCIEYDIGAQADNLTTLQRRFDATMAADIEESIARNGAPFVGLDPAPACYVQMWEANSASAAMKKVGVAPDNSPRIEYELAMCA